MSPSVLYTIHFARDVVTTLQFRFPWLLGVVGQWFPRCTSGWPWFGPSCRLVWCRGIAWLFIPVPRRSHWLAGLRCCAFVQGRGREEGFSISAHRVPLASIPPSSLLHLCYLLHLVCFFRWLLAPCLFVPQLFPDHWLYNCWLWLFLFAMHVPVHGCVGLFRASLSLLRFFLAYPGWVPGLLLCSSRMAIRVWVIGFSCYPDLDFFFAFAGHVGSLGAPALVWRCHQAFPFDPEQGLMFSPSILIYVVIISMCIWFHVPVYGCCNLAYYWWEGLILYAYLMCVECLCC